MIVVSVCLPSDALSQCLPSYLGFSYLGRGVSLHGCSSAVQPRLTTDHLTNPFSLNILFFQKLSSCNYVSCHHYEQRTLNIKHFICYMTFFFNWKTRLRIKNKWEDWPLDYQPMGLLAYFDDSSDWFFRRFFLLKEIGKSSQFWRSINNMF